MTFGPLQGDALATLLLASHLALTERMRSEAKPLSGLEWNRLTDDLKERALRPADLLGKGVSELQSLLALSTEMAGRIATLIGRGVQLALELERLHGRGIWVLTRSDEAYPQVLKRRLKKDAPPVLFGAGAVPLLQQGFLAVVGSRHVDEAGSAFATDVGVAVAKSGLVVVSGGAQGVDRLAIEGGLSAGGSAIAVLADSLERAIREPAYLSALLEGRLVLVSAVHPGARFSVPAAMARNKYIYALARYGLVVASDPAKGGTRAGALEVLQHGWVPLLVRETDPPLLGNQDLIRRGALAWPEGAVSVGEGLHEWLEARTKGWKPPPVKERRQTRQTHSATAPDLYHLVLPHLLALVQSALHPAQVAVSLGVVPEQALAWLRRAEGEGKVRYDGDTGYFQLGGTPAASQLTFKL